MSSLFSVMVRVLSVPFSVPVGKLLVSSGKIVKPDIVASNGVIHEIDNVDIGLIHEFLEAVEKSGKGAQK